jgi:hypothetical protein
MRPFLGWFIGSGLSLLFVLGSASRPHAAEPPTERAADGHGGAVRARPLSKIIVSKETTYVLGPLREDGLPDFNAALNELAGKGVTAENNAAVFFWQAIGPEPRDSSYGRDGRAK